MPQEEHTEWPTFESILREVAPNSPTLRDAPLDARKEPEEPTSVVSETTTQDAGVGRDAPAEIEVEAEAEIEVEAEAGSAGMVEADPEPTIPDMLPPLEYDTSSIRELLLRRSAAEIIEPQDHHPALEPLPDIRDLDSEADVDEPPTVVAASQPPNPTPEAPIPAPVDHEALDDLRADALGREPIISEPTIEVQTVSESAADDEDDENDGWVTHSPHDIGVDAETEQSAPIQQPAPAEEPSLSEPVQTPPVVENPFAELLSNFDSITFDTTGLDIAPTNVATPDSKPAPHPAPASPPPTAPNPAVDETPAAETFVNDTATSPDAGLDAIPWTQPTETSSTAAQVTGFTESTFEDPTTSQDPHPSPEAEGIDELNLWNLDDDPSLGHPEATPFHQPTQTPLPPTRDVSAAPDVPATPSAPPPPQGPPVDGPSAPAPSLYPNNPIESRPASEPAPNWNGLDQSITPAPASTNPNANDPWAYIRPKDEPDKISFWENRPKFFGGDERRKARARREARKVLEERGQPVPADLACPNCGYESRVDVRDPRNGRLHISCDACRHMWVVDQA